MDESTRKKISKLRHLLKNLPAKLPLVVPISGKVPQCSHDLASFSPDAEWVKEEGLEVAVNRELEVRLGSRAMGPFKIHERGPLIEALADVLEQYLGEFPASIYLKKWLDDSLESASRVFLDLEEKVPQFEYPVPGPTEREIDPVLLLYNGDHAVTESQTSKSASALTVRLKLPGPGIISSSSSSSKVTIGPNEQKAKVASIKQNDKTTKKAKSTTHEGDITVKKSMRLDTKKLENFEDPGYVDLPEIQSEGKGRKTSPLLLMVSRYCLARDSAEKIARGENAEAQFTRRLLGSDLQGDTDSLNGSTPPKPERVRCIGSAGCKTTWATPRNAQRVIAHAKDCAYIPVELQVKATVHCASKATLTSSISFSEDFVQAAVDGQRNGGNNEVEGRGESSSITASRTSRTSATPLALNSSFPSTMQQSTLSNSFVKRGMADLKAGCDNALMELLVCNGIPISLVDSKEFQKFASGLNPKYLPASSSTIETRIIPNEAARIRVMVTQYLRTLFFLTLSFDGGKIIRPQALYTIHITTPDRRSFLWDINDGSRLSHTANYIMEFIDNLMYEIGPAHFSAVVSDSAGNTKKARRLLTTKYPNILNLSDCCHQMDKALKSIARLEDFKEVIGNIRTIIAFMSKSTYAMEQFNEARTRLKISRGLETIGETRFGLIYWSAESLRRGFPALKEIVRNPLLNIDIAGCNNLFKDNSFASIEFEQSLFRLCSVMGPFAKAIKCLESTNSLLSDVYLFWLAATAELHDLLKNNPSMLKTSTANGIRAIVNKRFTEMIGNGSSNVYIAAFYFDPRNRGAKIYKNLNPVSLKITIPLSRTAPHTDTDANIEDAITKKVGLTMLQLLKNEYRDNTKTTSSGSSSSPEPQNPFLPTTITAATAVACLKGQIKAFSKGQEPFNRQFRPNETVLDWWKALCQDVHAHVLSALVIKLLSVVPNSMMDERTMSTITWLNSPRRNRQSVQTIKDHVTIRQWHRWNPTQNARNTVKNPTVKWRDMTSTIHGKRKRESQGNSANAEISTSADTPLDTINCSVDDDGTDSSDDEADSSVGRSRSRLPEDRFVLGDEFDLDSLYLRDVLSETPLLRRNPVEYPEEPQVAAEDTEFDNIDWEDW